MANHAKSTLSVAGSDPASPPHEGNAGMCSTSLRTVAGTRPLNSLKRVQQPKMFPLPSCVPFPSTTTLLYHRNPQPTLSPHLGVETSLRAHVCPPPPPASLSLQTSASSLTPLSPSATTAPPTLNTLPLTLAFGSCPMSASRRLFSCFRRMALW